MYVYPWVLVSFAQAPLPKVVSRGKIPPSADRLRELAGIVGKVDAAVPQWCSSFLSAVKRDQNW
jgi:hypothetical protein